MACFSGPAFGPTWLAGTRCHLDTSIFETDSGLAARSAKKTGPRSYFLRGPAESLQHTRSNLAFQVTSPGLPIRFRQRLQDSYTARYATSNLSAMGLSPFASIFATALRHRGCRNACRSSRSKEPPGPSRGNSRPDHGIIAGGLLRVHPWVSLGFSRGLGEERAH